MDRDILALIARESTGFSKGQRAISKYILENYDKAAFMTAGRLGRTVGVSESTVVRFAAELGYDGYPGMRKALQEMIRNRLSSVQRIEVAKEFMEAENVLKSVLEQDMEKLQTTHENVDQQAFDTAVDAIVGARRVYILGMRSSATLASFLGYYFHLLLPDVHLIQDTALSDAYEQIHRIGKDDVFIGISYPRYSSRTLKAMKYAKSQGAQVIGLTDGSSSPFVGVADVNLFAKSDMVSFLDSLVAPLSLINALIVSVGIRAKDELSDTFQQLEGVWAANDVYEKFDS